MRLWKKSSYSRQKSLEVELLGLEYIDNHSMVSILGHIVIISLLLANYAHTVPWQTILVSTIFHGAVFVLRYVTVRSYRAQKRKSMRLREVRRFKLRFAFGLMLTSLAWVFMLFSFSPYLTMYQEMFFVVIFVGLAGSSIGLIGVSFLIYVSFMVPLIGGSIVWMGLHSKVDLVGEMLISSLALFYLASAAMNFSNSFKSMILEKEKIKDISKMFEKFVPIRFLERISSEGIEKIKLGNAQLSKASILFLDMRNFTTLAENMSPQEVLNFLNSFFHRVNEVIHKHGGIIDKFIGDAVLAVFDQGEDVKRNAFNAVACAKDLQAAMVFYNQHRKNSGYEGISIGIGIHSGAVIVGTVGSNDRMDSTVLGDSVNVAARLETLTKQYNVSILISDYTRALIDEDSNDFVFNQVDSVQVKGRAQLFDIYTVA